MVDLKRESKQPEYEINQTVNTPGDVIVFSWPEKRMYKEIPVNDVLNMIPDLASRVYRGTYLNMILLSVHVCRIKYTLNI